MLLVSLIPILIVGVMVYLSMSSAEDKADGSLAEARTSLEEDTIGAGKAIQAWNLSVDLETWIAERIAEVRSWARNSSVVRAAQNLSDDDQNAWKFLGGETEGTPFYENAWLTDVDGNTIVEASIFDTGDKSKNPAMQKAKETGLCVGDVYLGSLGSVISQVYFVDVAVRVEDAMSGEVYGVVAGVVEFNPSTLGQRYAEKVPGCGVVIWDRFGNLITDSENTDRYNEEESKWTEIEAKVLEATTGTVEKIDGNYVITEDSIAGYASATNDDVNVRHPSYDGLGWMVMVEQPSDVAFAALESLEDLEDDLEANTNTMIYLLIAMIIAVVIVVPVLAFFLSRGITKPIAHLNDAAEKVSMGDLDVTVTVKSDDEIGDLAESFGRMVTAVKFLSEDED